MICALRITGPCYRGVGMCIAGFWDLPWFLGWWNLYFRNADVRVLPVTETNFRTWKWCRTSSRRDIFHGVFCVQGGPLPVIHGVITPINSFIIGYNWSYKPSYRSYNPSYPGGGFKYFLFSPLFGEGFQFDWYFSNGLKPPTRFGKGSHLVMISQIFIRSDEIPELDLPDDRSMASASTPKAT